MGAAAVGPLIASLNHDNPMVRSHAVDVLCEIRSPAVQPLIVALSHSHPSVRGEAARALGLIWDARAQDPLIGALGDPEYDVRGEVVGALVRLLKVDVGFSVRKIAQALGRTGDSRAVEALIEMLKYYHGFDNTSLRNDRAAKSAEVVLALGNTRDKRAVRPLIAELVDGKVGPNAAKALGQLGDSLAVEPLIAALRDKVVGPPAAGALGQLEDSRAIEPLATALNDDATRSAAATALLRLGDLRGFEVLMAELATEPFSSENLATVMEFGIKNRDHLVALLKDRWRLHKNRQTAELLVRLNEPPAKEYLARIILDCLEQTRREDDGLRLMASCVGMDTELLALAVGAFGFSYKTRDIGKYERELLFCDGGMSAIEKLCQRTDAWSSCILYRASRKKDVEISLKSCGPPNMGLRKLSFERERQAARDELIRRGFGDKDPITQL